MKLRVLWLALFWMGAALGFPAFSQPVDAMTAEELLFKALPVDRDALARWESDTRRILQTGKIEPGDTEALAAKSAMLALLDARRMPIADARGFDRACRVRSIQAVDYGVFAYDFFPCRFRLRDGLIVFEKNSGSQRRSGLAALDDRDGSLAFLGASYYSDEKPSQYSELKAKPTPADRDRDSVGRLYRIGEGRFLMGFIPLEGRAEVYEIRF